MTSSALFALRQAPTLWATIATLALIGTAFFATSPVRLTGSATELGGMTLTHSARYLIGAPMFGILDAITLLTPRQHAALMLTVVGAIVALSVVRECGTVSRSSLALIVVRALSTAVSVLVAAYLASVWLWRPMAALRVSDPDDVVIDFHSHTSASHDGRRGFDAERNREWHRAAGFHVAYVTDHGSLAGVRAGALRNPRRNGEGTVLLGGLEMVVKGHHVNLLGIHADANNPLSGEESKGSPNERALTLLTIPDQLTPSTHLRLDAVELADAAPRGISFAERHRTDLLHLADSLDLAVVAGSDNHGWGRTAAAWSVMRIPGWRLLTPPALDSAIRSAIRDHGRRAVRVVERRTIGGDGTAWVAAMTVPRMLWVMATMITPVERDCWIAWLWGLQLILHVRRRRARASLPVPRNWSPVAHAACPPPTAPRRSLAAASRPTRAH